VEIKEKKQKKTIKGAEMGDIFREKLEPE